MGQKIFLLGPPLAITQHAPSIIWRLARSVVSKVFRVKDLRALGELSLNMDNGGDALSIIQLNLCQLLGFRSLPQFLQVTQNQQLTRSNFIRIMFVCWLQARIQGVAWDKAR